MTGSQAYSCRSWRKEAAVQEARGEDEDEEGWKNGGREWREWERERKVGEGRWKEREREVGSLEEERSGERDEKKGLKAKREEDKGGKARRVLAEETTAVR